MDSDDPVPQRIGDAERDFAVEQLREHHSQGRLDSFEFEERMSKALEARTGPELARLFRDLPGPNPGAPVSSQPPPPVPQPSPYSVAPQQAEHPETPWFAQWWWIVVAVGVTVVSRGNVGFIIPMMAIWLFVIWPNIAKSRRRPAIDDPAQGARLTASLTEWQRQQVLAELGQGRKIQAIKMYREYTGAGLKLAKDEVERMGRQIGRGY